jgi:hypothetical protein
VSSMRFHSHPFSGPSEIAGHGKATGAAPTASRSLSSPDAALFSPRTPHGNEGTLGTQVISSPRQLLSLVLTPVSAWVSYRSSRVIGIFADQVLTECGTGSDRRCVPRRLPNGRLVQLSRTAHR